MMIRFNTTFALIVVLVIKIVAQQVSFLPKDDFYPRWLKDDFSNTEQTSGIAFIGLNSNKEKVFLLADDIGSIHRLTIKADTTFEIKEIVFTEEVNDFLAKFRKKDFEEITFDRVTQQVYLSIEGNGPEYKDYVGLYRIFFSSHPISSDTIVSISKVLIQPVGTIWKYTADNIGFEGVAVDSHYIYLGLEGFQNESTFADSTLIFIVDKKSLRIIKTINTKELGIHTICGLYCDKELSLWGVDRNNRKIFRIIFSKDFNVNSLKFYNFISRIPGYQNLSYVASLESITFDNENYMYCIDDPWKQLYVPVPEILNKLDPVTIKNFKEFIPIIYRYKILN